ncbi:MAG: hypothetical protein H0V17_35220 [Deltaproteobacteria bacterium]|nr:hypothetical protein [Deltaproteobacteria bacterium]
MRVIVVAACLFELAACKQLLGFDEVVLTDKPDGPRSDSGDPLPDGAGSLCFGTFATICLDALPTEPFVVSANDTLVQTTELCATTVAGTTVDACVIVGTSIQVDGVLRAFGTRPLVLIATESFSIGNAGVIDVSSVQTEQTQLGAGARACAPSLAATAGGGGAGGSLTTSGGAGGNGGGGNGGIPAASSAVTTLIGGCSGSPGTGAMAGAAGHGGGAVLVIASTLSITGRINASGAGAAPAVGDQDGGGGGGSGGVIILDASAIITVSGTARLIAQGGGGGGGDGGGGGAEAGQDPNPATPGVAAQGGAGSDVGAGAGGDGGVAGGGGAGENAGGKGGGGGGGSTGLIRGIAPMVTNNGVSSPGLMP